VDIHLSQAINKQLCDHFLINRTKPCFTVGVSRFFSSPLPHTTILREATNGFETEEDQQKNCLKQSGLYFKWLFNNKCSSVCYQTHRRYNSTEKSQTLWVHTVFPETTVRGTSISRTSWSWGGYNETTPMSSGENFNLS
jgi:hypothetical protein